VAEPEPGQLTGPVVGTAWMRPVAAAAGLAVPAGAVVMLVALAAAPGPWTTGYVSEAGTAGQPYAVPYRWGLVLLAAGVALLALALRRHRAAAALLGAAALLAGTSAVVPCSGGCPLPPYQPATPADLVHAGASVAGMVLLAGAMAAVARADLPRMVRRVAAASAVVIVPIGAALGLTMLVVGRGPVGAVLERLVLVVAVTWLTGTAVALALSRPGGLSIPARR
jgi:hypothetical protein